MEQWPLDAASSQALIDCAEGQRRYASRNSQEIVRLALVELVVRSALRMEVVAMPIVHHRVSLQAGDRHAVPASLAAVHDEICAELPEDLEKALKRAKKKHRRLADDFVEALDTELAGQGLLYREPEKRSRWASAPRWRCTPAGEAWAETATQHVDALIELGSRIDRDLTWAASTVIAAGPVSTIVPIAWGHVVRLRDERTVSSELGSLGREAPLQPIEAIGRLADTAPGLEPSDIEDLLSRALHDALGGGLKSHGSGGYGGF